MSNKVVQPNENEDYFRHLDPDRTIRTTVKLYRRINERFPNAKLGLLCHDLAKIAQDSKTKSIAIAKPNWLLRIALVALLALWAISVHFGAGFIRFSIPEGNELPQLVQWIEPMLNVLASLGVALYFLISLEGRIRRKRALKALYELRSMAHVIDMYQLTKDPTVILGNGPSTPNSPKHVMSRFELTRYLDYCSEMLSLTGKLAALYSQYSHDEVVHAAANDIEDLSTNLSRKVWQKIVMLQTLKDVSNRE